jgi:RHS repeat-associated protein
VAERTTDTAGVNTYNWLGTDAQGTAQVEVDTVTGATTVRNQDPFGIARGGAAAWSSTHGFLNASVSDFTGLVQLGARLYDSTIGRFLTVDPVLDTSSPAQMNGYSYASNSPITMSDASGELAGCASTYIAELGCQASNKANAAKKAGSGGGGASTASAGSGSVAKAPPKPKQVDWWNPTTWDADAWQDAAAIATGIVVGVVVTVAIVGAVACTAATFGVCAAVIVGAGVVGGAAGAAVTYNTSSGDKSAEGLANAVGWGAVGGAIGGVVAPIVGKVFGAVAPKVVGALSKVSKSAGASEAAPRFVAGAKETIDTGSDALRNQLSDVTTSLRDTGSPPPGVRQGGAPGHPGVFENRVPRGASSPKLPERPFGYYTESDVWPGPGPRGTERVVRGDGGEAWYSPDHYGTFREIR